MSQKPFFVEQIAAYALRVSEADLGQQARSRLKLSILDTLGCAIGAWSAEPVRRIRQVVEEFGGAEQCSLIGAGRAAPDRATLVNGCLVRYLDFMDNIAGKGEVCHPSDNFSALLAAAEYAGASGTDLLVGLALAYQVQGRLMTSLPTMRAGLNYTTPLAFSVAAGCSRLLGLDVARTANAIALAGVTCVSLAVIQAEPVSQWKGLASGEVASRALHNTFLARAGITGPLGVFEGPFGLDHLVGDRSKVDWSREALDIATQVSIKRYNAEFQSQTAVDGAVELHAQHLHEDKIERIDVEVAKGAFDVLGGGPYGAKEDCHNKEQADHNLKYLVAVALLDGQVWPEQFTPERINRADVQSLLRKVQVSCSRLYTHRIPEQMPVKVTVKLKTGQIFEVRRDHYHGFHTHPMNWADVAAKFHRLTSPVIEEQRRARIVRGVRDLETLQVRDLTGLLQWPG